MKDGKTLKLFFSTWVCTRSLKDQQSKCWMLFEESDEMKDAIVVDHQIN